MVNVHQQVKGSDLVVLQILQEVAERRGVSTNQGTQTSKTLAEREEEVGARLP